ncbi:type IV secretion system protein VirB9 [Cupriavidus basilensis OR16]|uniref:Type IV secretion system protein VirB9 n=1 Tax=Cupriavidus basilensis OR16 TaxID=1127483 RepID=H1RZV0_9BURK|nr:TrbG/VirB9 family P-type conjugative transfer protein [Cupriavidus basilensis]EHP44166.1 type IV secretion system protein VirB9 [Cupriavidus basilensis OR16]
MKSRTISRAVFLAAAAALQLAAMPAQAAKAPNALITDARVKQVAYDANQVYEITGTYGYQTAIEFGRDETVKVVTLGDTIAWQTVPYLNRLFLKPVEPNAATNLTVITDKHTYFFRLNSADARAPMTFVVRFLYPSANPILQGAIGVPAAEAVPSRLNEGFDVAKLNLSYSSAGDKAAVQLNRVFDDGQFTYFLFEPNAEIPAFYAVGADGTESVLNRRREGPYMVVERTAGRFTLRNGNAYLCVQNNGATARVGG